MPSCRRQGRAALSHGLRIDRSSPNIDTAGNGRWEERHGPRVARRQSESGFVWSGKRDGATALFVATTATGAEAPYCQPNLGSQVDDTPRAEPDLLDTMTKPPQTMQRVAVRHCRRRSGAAAEGSPGGFSAGDKLAGLEQYDACEADGDKGTLRRRRSTAPGSWTSPKP